MAKKKGSELGAVVLVLFGGVAWVVIQYGRELLILGGVALAIWIAFKIFGSSTEAPRPPNRRSGPAYTPSRKAVVPYEPQPAAVVRTMSTNGDDYWRETTLGGRRLGGWIYSGKDLAAACGRGVEPALVDVSLPIDRSVQDCGVRRLDYWPSYSAASPQARAAYLHWLNTGRQDPQADIGYVFLYFYGLERRALHDAENSQAAKSELPAIKQELERLKAIYKANRAFQRYAGSLLELLNYRSVDDRLYNREPPPLLNGRELTLPHRIALAQCAKDNKPLPDRWAYTWFVSDPTTYLRSAAIRCPGEFRRLFTWKYQEMYGQGISLPQNRTMLKLERRPASATFGGGNTVHTLQFTLPDVSVLTSPVRKLQEVADACYALLDPYSRFISKNLVMANTFDAIVELPYMLWPDEARKPIEQARQLIERAGKPLAIPFAKLRTWFPDWQLINKSKLLAFCRALGEGGLGMEPDPRFGGALPSEQTNVALFADDNASAKTVPDGRYSAAALMLHLGTAVASADGRASDIEKAILRRRLEESLHLSESERRRLQARLRLMLLEPPKLTGLKQRVEVLDLAQKEAIGDFLTLIALADVQVTPGEIATLEKTFKVLRLDPKTVYAKLHLAATEPVTVKPGTNGPVDYAIPRPPKEEKSTGIRLDPSRIAALQADSERVAMILGAIFAPGMLAPEPEPEVGAKIVPTEPAQPQEPLLLGLDMRDSALVRTLLTRAHWARVELEELAADRGLMLDGALERLNDAAFEKFDKPLMEGTDPIDINPAIVHEVLQ